MPGLSRVLGWVIFYGLLATIVLTAVPYGTVQPWSIALFECAILLLGLLGLVDLLLTNSTLPHAASLAVPLIALCLFILFQSLPLFGSQNDILPSARLSISADPFSTMQLAVKLFVMIVAGLLLLRYAKSRRRLRVVVYVVIGVGVASAVFGIMRQGMQTSPGSFLSLPPGSRGFAQFVNRNHFGFLIEIALGLALGLLVRGSEGIQRYAVLLPATVVMWVALIVSNTRGGIFASGCQLLFLVIMLDPLRRLMGGEGFELSRARALAGAFAVRTVLIVFLIGVFAYGVSWVGGETVVGNFELAGYSFTEQGGKINRENVSRRDIWSATWQLIKAHPIAGSGFGAYWIAITRFHNASGTFTPQEAHNDYLELLASGGLIGAGLVLWFFVRLIKSARNTLQSSSSFTRAAALGAVTGIFGVMIHNFVDFGLHVTTNALMFTVLVVLAGHRGLKSIVHERQTSLAEWEPFEGGAEADFATH